ncbi:MAG: PLP-dependent aminotransferase family protein [Vicinamibacteria bacterium]|nr:PLP-dependent aminotransferase family protein [Vicinamibacteria bacterium]
MTHQTTSRRRRTSGLGLLIRLDPGERGGLQRQIYAGVRRAILDGVLPPGTRVPSSRELAADLRVSRTTSLLALEQLVAEGYLAARAGSGTFVAHELPDDRPRAHGTPPSRAARHPPLSKRGKALAAGRPPSDRLAGPPRPFRIGVPAVDLFPVRTWSQLVTRRLRSASPSQLDYGETTGALELRVAIAAHVRAARGTECDPEQVLVVSGAQRAIDLLCQLLLDPGDEAWMEEPGYPGARNALVAAGARIHPVRVDDEGIDVAAGARVAPRARLVYVTPSHQFPLGVPMSLRRRLALLQWASSAGAWVIEDDYDAEFRHGARPVPCLHGLDADGRVLYVGSFSKTLFPALRLGFVIAPRDLHDPLVAVRRASELHPPRLDQAVLADFMREGHYERHLRRMRRVYRERLEALEHAARRHCAGALKLRPALTGLHAVADLVEADAGRVFAAAARHGVEVMPLSAYGFGRSRPPDALVLGFGAVRADAMDAGMERLAAAIDEARRGSRRSPTAG